MNDDVVKIEKVEKRFGDVLAVRGIDLDIKKGEFLTLLGPSGCGKTTLLRMIAGFESPSSGRIVIDGKDVTHIPTYRRPIGMVLQNLALFPHMNVRENVIFGLITRGETVGAANAKAKDVLGLVGLTGYEERLVHQLSGGQRQRVALARSVVMEPAVLLLDEPLGALDLKLRQQLQAELKRIQKQIGITFVFVTHDQEEAMTMSDRIAVVNQGQIEQLGEPSAIYDNPKTLFVANFIGDTNLFQGKVTGTREDGVDVQLDGSTASIGARGKGLKVGDRVQVMVRPDYVKLDQVGQGLRDGTVSDRTFIGAGFDYRIDLHGSEVKVRSPHRPGESAADIGAPVSVNWRGTDAIALPA